MQGELAKLERHYQQKKANGSEEETGSPFFLAFSLPLTSHSQHLTGSQLPIQKCGLQSTSPRITKKHMGVGVETERQ